MEGINFSALAPRIGSRPMLSSWSDIGTSSMNGGAFNWGSLWSGIKSFGSTVKNWGNRAWNSSTAQAVRQQLKDSNVQEKIAQGIANGIHGAVDLANQEIAKAIEKRLQSRPVPDALVEDPGLLSTPSTVPSEEIIVERPSAVGTTVESVATKRPLEEEELVIRTDEPPRYEELYPTKAAPPAVSLRPTAVSPAAPVLAAPVEAPATGVVRPGGLPSRRNRGWQGTLNSIVGLGVRSVKRRRCF